MDIYAITGQFSYLRHEAVGEGVKVDDIVATIDTDKVSFEIRATVAGVISEQCVPADSNVKVGQDLFKIAVGEVAKGELN